jgi:hypothetical protein
MKFMHTRTIALVAALPAALALALIAPAVSAQTLPAAGTTSSGTYTLPGSRTTAEEYPWVIRILSYHPKPIVPRRMYSTSCTYQGVRKFHASLTSKTQAGEYHGILISGDVTTTGAVANFSSRVFTGCKDMAGIVAASDCSTVAALCRKGANTTMTPTKDLVASLPNTSTGNAWRDALTADSTDDQMWLYEWQGNPAAPTNSDSTVRSYIVSKAIGSWEYGHQNLVMSGSHYGVSLKSTTGTGANGKHEGDSFIAVTRTSPSIDTNKGWSWACASGHTLANRPVLSTTGKFGAFCTTDWNNVANDYTKGGIFLRLEGSAAVLTRSIYELPSSSSLIYNGGGTSILPTANGEFIGVIVGSPDPSKPEASRIGLVRFNSAGAPVSTMWVKSSSTHFLSYPQLVSLGNDSSGTPRYLLGWGQMMRSSSTSTLSAPKPDETQRLATYYYVQEINANGDLKSESKSLGNGWGEQDQMVSLGSKRAGWIHRPDGRIKLTSDGSAVESMPSPNSTNVIFMTYTSTSM